jgi:hypothetical protein
MNKSQLVEKIKAQLKSLVSQKFAEVKAGDLMITSPDEALAIGSEVFTVDTDGNNIPLTDGEYTLDYGVKIAVVAGKIEAMVNPEAEVEAAVEEVVAPEGEVEVEVETPEAEAPANEEKPEEDMPATAEEMKKLMERVMKCEEMITELVKQKEQMAQEFSKLAEQPSTGAIEINTSEFKSVDEKKSGFGSIDVMAIRDKARKNR